MSDSQLDEKAPTGYRLAVSVVAVQGSKILLVQRAREPGKGSFAFPGGKVETGEALEDAARRELMEETGLTAGLLTAFDRFTIRGATGGYLLHVFEADCVQGVLRAGDDASDASWFSIEEIAALAVPQSVRDVIARILGRIS